MNLYWIFSALLVNRILRFVHFGGERFIQLDTYPEYVSNVYGYVSYSRYHIIVFTNRNDENGKRNYTERMKAVIVRNCGLPLFARGINMISIGTRASRLAYKRPKFFFRHV